MSLFARAVAHSALGIQLLQMSLVVATTFWLASALYALIHKSPTFGSLAVVGLWTQLVAMFFFFEHPNLATLVILHVIWCACVAMFWKDTLETFLKVVVFVKLQVKECCKPPDFYVVDRSNLAIFASCCKKQLQNPQLVVTIYPISTKQDGFSYGRTFVRYNYLGDEFVSLLDVCIHESTSSFLWQSITPETIKLAPPIEVVMLVGNDQKNGISVDEIFKPFFTAHFPAKKTLFDFGLVAMIWKEHGRFFIVETQLKLPRTRFRFTNLISNKQAEYDIDFADPHHDHPITLDDVLASIKEDPEEDGVENFQQVGVGNFQQDPLITELKQVQETKGLVEENKFDRFKTGRPQRSEFRTYNCHQEEEERPREPPTPRIDTFGYEEIEEEGSQIELARPDE